MYQRFRRIITEKIELDKEDHLLLALSGGVDSVVLLHLFLSLPEDLRPKISLAHVHHHLRQASDQELVFVEELAEEAQLDLHVKHWENPPQTAIEEEARKMRYSYFSQLMKELGANILATGHHSGDQVETVLMRLVRGGAWQRLAGIRCHQDFSGGCLVRPLLAFSKSDIYAYADHHQLAYVEDASNLDQDFTRNRFRHQIIPLLKDENPQLESHMQVLAEEIQDLQAFTDQHLADLLDQSTEESQDILDRDALLVLKPFEQSLLLKYWLRAQEKNKSLEIQVSAFSDILEWIKDGQPNASYDLGQGLCLTRRYQELFVSPKSSRIKDQQLFSLQMNQKLELTKHESIALLEADQAELGRGDLAIYLNPDEVTLPLIVRHRQAGDRMSIKGLNGRTKKVKDIFIDQKIPLEMRDQAWLVLDAQDRILWLVNYKESQFSQAADRVKKQYVLVYRKGEES